MSLPSRADRHVDHNLTDFSLGYIQDAGIFVAREIVDMTPVMQQSNTYPIYDKGDIYRDSMQQRAWGTESEGINFRLSSDNYYCKDYALHRDIADPERDDADPVFDNLDTEATEILTQKALIKEDRVCAANLFTTSVFNTDQTGVSSGPSTDEFLQFDQSSSDPIGVIEKSLDFVEEQTGFRPNKVVMGARCWRVVKNHTDVLDRMKHVGVSSVTKQAVAAMLEVDRLIVPRGAYNTAAEGATTSMDRIWTDNAFLTIYTAGSPSRRVPTAARLFSWNRPVFRAALRGRPGFAVKKFRIESRESDRVEIAGSFDIKLTAADLGQFHASAVAATA